MIKKIKAREILDSKGTPTIEVELETGSGKVLASVPSGVSRGKYEAVELRDGGKRYQGKGVQKAVRNVNEIIGPKLIGRDPSKQKEIDNLLIRLDGTKRKSKLGANSILAVSLAVCRAGARAQKIPLWKWISKLSGQKPSLPLPSVLLAEGGLHGRGGSDIQEFMIVCLAERFSRSFSEAENIYRRFKKLISKKYLLKVGLEGGFILPLKRPEELLDLILLASGRKKIKFFLDIAASHFSPKINFLELTKYPLLGLEDPFPEDDWQSWQKLIRQLSGKAKGLLIIGDDLTTTNKKRIKMAYQKKACNAIIVKPNQAGTLIETIESALLAKSFGWKTIISHRSGETMDSFIADLAVGLGADFIKSGAPSQPERMAKYNRLLKIEKEL